MQPVCISHSHPGTVVLCHSHPPPYLHLSLSLSPPLPWTLSSHTFLSSRCNRWHPRWRACEAPSVKNDSRALTTCSALAWPGLTQQTERWWEGGVGSSSETVAGVLQIPPPITERETMEEASLLHLSNDLQRADLVGFFCRRSCGSNHQSVACAACDPIAGRHLLRFLHALGVIHTLQSSGFTSSDRFLHRWALPRAHHRARRPHVSRSHCPHPNLVNWPLRDTQQRRTRRRASEVLAGTPNQCGGWSGCEQAGCVDACR